MSGSSMLAKTLLGGPLFLIVGCMTGILPQSVLSVWSKAVHWARGSNGFTPPHRRQFNFDGIRPHVFLGRQPRSQADLKQMEDSGIKAVVSLNEDWELFVPSSVYANTSFDRLHIPVPDFQGFDVDTITNAVKFIHKYVSKEHGVFVHCNAGKGRSSTIVAAYLLFASKHNSAQRFPTVSEVVSEMRQKRPQVMYGKLFR